MGLIMSPGSVMAQLDSMNSQLEKAIENAGEGLRVMAQLAETKDELSGKSYDSMREYYELIHIPVLQGIILYAEALMQENNAYEGCISGNLSGIGYVDEDALKEDRDAIKRQIDAVYGLMSRYKGSFSDYLSALERALELVEKKLDQIDSFMDSAAGLYQGMDSYRSLLHRGIICLRGNHFNRNTRSYEIDGIAKDWIEDIEKNWTKKTERLFYNQLSDSLKAVMSFNDFIVTTDGFVLCNGKSLEDIFLASGLNQDSVCNTEKNDTVELYDNWYLAGLMGENGDIVYTLIKIRTLGDNQEPGTAVPFIALNMEIFEETVLKLHENKGQLSEKEWSDFSQALTDVIYGAGEADKSLLSYFRNPATEASYLIADCLINKTAESGIFDENGNYSLKHGYDENVKWCKKKLDALETMGIYDRQTNSIHVENVNKLTQEERNAIMVVTTGNPDIYSFAAENQFHADKYGQYLGIWNGNAIASDAGVGESGSAEYYEYLFKEKDKKYYREQVQVHKK